MRSSRRSHRPETQTSEIATTGQISARQRGGDSINRKSTTSGILKKRSATLQEFTKGQSCQTLSCGESEYPAAVTTTGEALHLQHLLEFLRRPVKPQLLIDSTAARGIIQRQRCGPFKQIETILLWLQAKHEERKLTVVRRTDSNEHSRWVHVGIAESEVSGMSEPSQYGIRQR